MQRCFCARKDFMIGVKPDYDFNQEMILDEFSVLINRAF